MEFIVAAAETRGSPSVVCAAQWLVLREKRGSAATYTLVGAQYMVCRASQVHDVVQVRVWKCSILAR
jgi:hypothetical protein